MSKPRRPYQNMPTKKLKEILDSAPYYTTEIGTDYGPIAHLIEAEYWHRMETAKDKMEKTASRDYDRHQLIKEMNKPKLPKGTTDFQIDNELPPLPPDKVEDIPVIESKFDVKELSFEELKAHLDAEIYTVNDPLLHEAWERFAELLETKAEKITYARQWAAQFLEVMQ